MEYIIKNIKSHRWSQWLGLMLMNTVFFAVLAMLLPIMFEDNDDTTMVWIANGVYSGTPDCHLVFINAIWGTILSWLYTLFGNIEWYVLTFAVGQIITTSILVDKLYRSLKDRWWIVLSFVALYAVWALLIVRLQFTTTAAYIALGACVLLLDKRFVTGGVLLLWASLIRFDAAGLVGLMMVPAFLNSYRLNIKRAYVPLFAILMCIWGCHVADSFFYQTEEWRAYKALNTPRGIINDNPNLWRIYQDFPSEQVDSLNFRLVTAFAMDPKVTSPEELNIVVKQLHNIPLRKRLKNVIRTDWSVYFVWYFIFGLIFVGLLIGLPNVYDKWLLSAVIVFWLVVHAYIAINACLKFRVFFTSVLPMLYYVVYGMSKQRKDINIVRRIGILIGICLLLAMEVFPICVRQISKIRINKTMVDEQLSLYQQRDNSVIVPAGAVLSVEFLEPFTLFKAIDKCSFVNPYCMAGSPLTPNYQSYWDFIDKDLIYFTDKEDDVKEHLDALYRNYHVDADTIHIAESEHYVLVKFVR